MTENISIRSYAYIGDAVYELFIREKTVFITPNADELHKITSSVVKADFHAGLLEKIRDFTTDEEKEIIRRAGNLSVTTKKRKNQKMHRLSTAFEALVGYLYFHDKDRLKELFDFIESFIDTEINEKLVSYNT